MAKGIETNGQQQQGKYMQKRKSTSHEIFLEAYSISILSSERGK